LVTETQARNAYDVFHQRFEVDEEAQAPWHGMLKPFLLAEDLRGKRVLEIGCGRGGFSCWLAKNCGPELTAADFSPAGVKMGRDYAASLGLPVRWQVMDIQSIAHPNATFDCVISCETIEHVPNPALALRELARVLKPGGKLFLTTPNYFNAMGLYRGYMRLKGTPFTEGGQPINNFVTLPRTLRWVRDAGLKLCHTDSRGMYLPIPGRPWTLADWLDHPRLLTRWLGLHSLVIATRPE
jgi:2-polyprenyl-3-methyl-5-hydroxy-6-metoxy-1,4-benzoquinol methylase